MDMLTAFILERDGVETWTNEHNVEGAEPFVFG